MKTANNPFLATIQNKTSSATKATTTSTASNIDNRHNYTDIIVKGNSNTNTNSNININTNTNDKGNKKLRRQTISDPHAYIRYIHSLLGDKCITKSSASTLAKSPTITITTTTTTTATATTNNDKSQKQCQQQQQLQQIGLQFQGIALYDDDVAESQNNSNCSYNNNYNSGNKRNKDNNNKLEALEEQQQQQNVLRIISSPNYVVEDEGEDVRKQMELAFKEDGKFSEQIRWMCTYPATRSKKISISDASTTTTTTTYTTTANATRMTTKIAPTIHNNDNDNDDGNNGEGAMAHPIKSTLRKHHSFHMQPTYIMHKQMYLQQQPQSVAQTSASRRKEERDVNEIEQQLITSRYHATFGGPLVFRPLTLNEKHNFKPIARPDGMSAVCETILQQQQQQQQQQQDENKYTKSILSEQVCKVDVLKRQTDEQLSSSEEEFLKEIEQLNISLSSLSSSSSGTITPTPTNSPKLHAAASLEVLEALTQSNPELIYAAKQPGCRLNLQTQFSALNETHMSAGQTQLRAKLHATLIESANIEDNALRRNNIYFVNNDKPPQHDDNDDKVEMEEEEEEDLSFHEIPNNEVDTNDVSPNATIILNTSNNHGQVKYLVNKNLHEIHI